MKIGNAESELRFAQAFSKLTETFDGRVRLVFKNLPLVGPGSIAAAEAAQCANARGRFWQYHNAVVLPPGAVDAVRLKQAAADAGLDRPVLRITRYTMAPRM